MHTRKLLRAVIACSYLLLWCSLTCCASTHAISAAVINSSRVVEQLQHLAQYSDHPNPAVTRILFTPNDVAARQYIKNLMAEADLVVREDGVGNTYGRLTGSDPTAGNVLTGSHCDAIPLAGMYDGTVGVIGAIEAVAALRLAGYVPRRSIEVLMFTSEEPTRFGLSCIGSRAMSGALTDEVLGSKRDQNGSTLLQAAHDAGYNVSSHRQMLDASRVPEHEYSAFLELHIEQGPLLEQQGIDIGIVTAIAAPAALEVVFKGAGGHAGALLMPYRNDAGLAAAELALAVERHVLATNALDTVGTTGVMELQPNAVNSVPREARLEIDIRDVVEERRDRVLRQVLASAEAIAQRRNVSHTVRILSQDPPATCDDRVQQAIRDAAEELKLSHKSMVSRAYHDSLFMARIAPTGMIFIPCKDGISHRPDEFAREEDIRKGVAVLAGALVRLSEAQLPGGKDEL